MTLNDLYSLVPVGQGNAIKAADLAEIWSMSRREAERTREAMGMKNLIVCSLGKGYFRPASAGELQAYERYIHSYYKKFATKLYHIRVAMKRMGKVI